MARHVYLLDTNVLLATLLAPERLPPEVVAGVSDSSNTVYFSSASIWEIAIKHSLNRADFDFSPEDIHRLAQDTGFTELTVKGEDCNPLVNLPWHHRDPFDRLLIAQAHSLPAYLLTTDVALSRYSELVVHLVLRP
ncbi:MAG: twitching motility protein PilT [Gallionellales bacterium RIFCSPLOWO2_12_FULL_59_22]|nr:MAG: twitching motility protein PilT [Gallionellales bacterium RIFCSPLOWO2_02_FULL_59_110]OGT04602.1 MAG: twitching motility protein PilT [Gallionellales bacterium RIFCSPLOWO2_02_58_13]OGT12922.1 MAG: twitching motility protein PilT [Gallionellales bacterium RIFCSPLOWO2_12_FULL_59_22]